MAYVVINVLTVSEGAAETLEQRFAARAGAVDRAPGFERFELLRPATGTDRYLVYTRWRSQRDYQRWLASSAFRNGHAHRGQGPQSSEHEHPGPTTAGGHQREHRPAATESEIWAFEVAAASESS